MAERLKLDHDVPLTLKDTLWAEKLARELVAEHTDVRYEVALQTTRQSIYDMRIGKHTIVLAKKSYQNND